MALLARHALLQSFVSLNLFEKIAQSRKFGWHLLPQLLIFLHERIVQPDSRFLLHSIVLLMVKIASRRALPFQFPLLITWLSFAKTSVLLLMAHGMVLQFDYHYMHP